MNGPFKWILFLLTLYLSFFLNVGLQAQADYHIIFYNVENLFDTYDDPITEDEAFTTWGQNHWTIKRFNQKISMIYKTIITSCKGNFPDVIALAEIENIWVLEQLISRTPLKKYPYGIIHKESPDPRGIDVALLFRKDRITPVNFDFYGVFSKGINAFVSRDILYFTGQISGNPIHIFINHWPSRSGGYLETKEKRNIAAKILRASIDTLLAHDANAKILIMGDFNATPKEECLTRILEASAFSGSEDNNSLINLSSDWLKNRRGTICRNGQWEIFDQIICSRNLLDSGIRIKTGDTKICFLPFLLEPDRNYMGKKPFRTYLGPVYHGGISDHLPITTVLTINQ